MTADRLDRTFFSRDTLAVARDLLGKRLVRLLAEGQRLSGIIVETEAYVGETDRACHAARGRTPRNAVMYEKAGLAYVYLIYGIHHCLNAVTEQEGFPAAVLIRALEPQEGLAKMREFRSGQPDRILTSGPGRLCQALAIDRTFNGSDLCISPDLYVEEGDAPAGIVTDTRIGISADETARERLWRFCVAGNLYVSRPPRNRGTKVE